MREDLVLIGGGGHCKSCIDVIEQDGKFNIAGIIDLPENIGKDVLGYKIFACDDELAQLKKHYQNFLITTGHIYSNTLRVEMYNQLKNLGAILPVVISPKAYVSKHTTIGEGTIIMHGAQINCVSQIGNNCIINSKALIEHDAVIGNHSHISTGAIVNGGTIIGEGCFLGSNSVTKQYITVPDHTFVKANSLVK